MTAQVNGNCAEASIGEQGRNLLPGPPGLPASMRENHRHAICRALDSCDNGVAGLTFQLDQITLHLDSAADEQRADLIRR